MGLEMGADDYLTKPFSIQELLATRQGALSAHGSAAGTGCPWGTGTIGRVDLVIEVPKRKVRSMGRR